MAAEVDAFMAALDHPLKAGVETTRQIILAADESIVETVKWNAPSFRTSDDFATFHLRNPKAIQIVFHGGAKVKDGRSFVVDDPAGLLRRLAPDRCIATLPANVEAVREPLTAIVRQWISQL